MAEVILPPEEIEPEIPEEQLPEVEKPTEKSKVISVDFNPLNTKQTTSLDTRESFYTTDTDAWIVLNVGDMNEPTGQYSLALINKEDGSIFQRVGDIVQGVAYYKLLPNEIKHAGRWVGQAVITLANGQTTASRFSFNVSGHILDGKDVREIVIQDFQTLMKQLNDLKDNATNEFSFLKSEIEAFQTTIQENEDERQATELGRVAAEIIREENYESKVDSAIVEADVVEKVDNKVAELAPTIQQVTAQLAQNAPKIPYDLASKVKNKVDIPEIFSWKDIPINIYQNALGEFSTDSDISLYQRKGKTYYVSKSGSDNNDGLTLSTAFSSVNKARSQPDVEVIIVGGGVYQDSQAFNNGMAISGYKNLTIKAVEGEEVYLTTRRITIFTVVPDKPNLYRTNRSLVASVWDLVNKDEDGDYSKLENVSSIDVCENTPNSYYQEGDVLYVHRSDGLFPNGDNTAVYLDVANFVNSGPYVTYFENIHFEGGNKGCVYVTDNSGLARFYAKDCTFKYSSNGNGGLSIVGVDAITQGCIAACNMKDGFNYHYLAPYRPKVIEINGIGRDNGFDGSNQNNGSTNHDGVKVVRVNGKYHNNQGPNCHDITVGSESWNLGCESYESRSTALDRRTNYQIEGGTMILDGCVGYESNRSITVSSTGKMYVRNTLFDDAEQYVTGVFEKY